MKPFRIYIAVIFDQLLSTAFARRYPPQKFPHHPRQLQSLEARSWLRDPASIRTGATQVGMLLMQQTIGKMFRISRPPRCQNLASGPGFTRKRPVPVNSGRLRHMRTCTTPANRKKWSTTSKYANAQSWNQSTERGKRHRALTNKRRCDAHCYVFRRALK